MQPCSPPNALLEQTKEWEKVYIERLELLQSFQNHKISVSPLSVNISIIISTSFHTSKAQLQNGFHYPSHQRHHRLAQRSQRNKPCTYLFSTFLSPLSIFKLRCAHYHHRMSIQAASLQTMKGSALATRLCTSMARSMSTPVSTGTRPNPLASSPAQFQLPGIKPIGEQTIAFTAQAVTVSFVEILQVIMGL